MKNYNVFLILLICNQMYPMQKAIKSICKTSNGKNRTSVTFADILEQNRLFDKDSHPGSINNRPLTSKMQFKEEVRIKINKIFDELRTELALYQNNHSSSPFDIIQKALREPCGDNQDLVQQVQQFVTDYEHIGPEIPFLGKMILREINKITNFEYVGCINPCQKWCKSCSQSKEECEIVPLIADVLAANNSLGQNALSQIECLPHQLYYMSLQEIKNFAKNILSQTNQLISDKCSQAKELRTKLVRLFAKMEELQK